MFDTGHHPTITRQIVGDIKRLTTRPVRYVVVSHWHDDHFAGNAEFAKAYPGVQIIAHDFTAQMLESRNQLREKIDLSQFSDRFAHGDPFLKANFDAQMKGSAIDRMWQELTGQWKPEG